MQKFTGTITTHNPTRVKKLWEVKHDTGEYEGRNGQQYSSKLALWVPYPRNGEHKAGIFIRLSNPLGSSYARLSADEFADLYVFFRHNYAPAVAALQKAQAYTTLYSEAERALAIEQGLFKPERQGPADGDQDDGDQQVPADPDY